MQNVTLAQAEAAVVAAEAAQRKASARFAREPVAANYYKCDDAVRAAAAARMRLAAARRVAA